MLGVMESAERGWTGLGRDALLLLLELVSHPAALQSPALQHPGQRVKQGA